MKALLGIKEQKEKKLKQNEEEIEYSHRKFYSIFIPSQFFFLKFVNKNIQQLEKNLNTHYLQNVFRIIN